MSRGRRYDSEPKLNIKKVFGVIIAFVVLIMIIISIVKILKNDSNDTVITSSTYFSAYENHTWGIIDEEGNKVIDTNYDEMVIVPNNKKAVFICTYDIDEKTGEYKTKAINDKNEEILKGYEKIEAIDNYDKKQNIWFEANCLRVQKNGKVGLIDLEGKEVLKCEYDSINSLKGIENNFIIQKDGKVGLVNDKGQTIIEINYNKIETLKDGYKDAYLVTNTDGLKGIVSTTGTNILECKYEEIKYILSLDVFSVKENGKWELINQKGQILQIFNDKEYVFAKGDNVIVKKDNKFGLENLKGDIVIPYDYEELSYAFSIYYIAKKDGKYGVININNETIKEFEYVNMYVVEEGNCIVADKNETETVVLDNKLSQQINGIISEININKGFFKVYVDGEYKYYNFKFEEKENTDILTQNTLYLSKNGEKYGYKDKTGTLIVDYIYDDATEQNPYGFVSVKKDGKWGSLMKNGAIALEPSVNLDESIYIDFIGKWHLSDDGLYYTK